MNEAAQQVLKMAEIIQDECHVAVEYSLKNSTKPLTVQDATNVYLFTKLAEMQLEIEQLKSFSHTHQ